MATPLTAARVLRGLRDEGCTVREVRDWRHHNRNHKGPWGPVNGVMIHHTVTSSLAGTLRLVYEGRSDLPGPLAHAVIDKRGVIHMTGHGRANHAGSGDDDVLRRVIAESYGTRPPSPNENNTDGNARFYGFECINLGDGRDPWPKAQLDAIERASAALLRAHGWDAKSVIGHLEWTNQKIDPRGFGMPSMRSRIAERLRHPAGWDREDDMPLTSDDARKVWKTDGFIRSPNPDGPNRFWQPASYLRNTNMRLRKVQAQLEAQSVAISELARALAAHHAEFDPEAVVVRIEEAIAGITATVRLEIDEEE